MIVEEAHQLDWAALEAMAEPLAYLIGRRDYARTLRWAMERTRRVNAPLAEFDDDDVAETCDVSPEDVRATEAAPAVLACTAAVPALSRYRPLRRC